MKKITPMLATLIDQPFDEKGWIYETKWDGFRSIAIKDENVHLMSRNHKSMNERFPIIVEAVSHLPGRFIIDGEIVILDSKGKASFQMLQNYQRKKKGKPVYFVFDILEFQGNDLQKLPLIDRKKILKRLVGKSKIIRYNRHVKEKGISFFQKESKKGHEGILAKKADGTYQHRRSRDWLKIKAKRGQEVVIGGFTEPKGSRKHMGALLVGVYDKGKLHYAGSVGGGFNEELLKTIRARLRKLQTKKCPFVVKPKLQATWVKPQLICEISFAEWTSDGKLRQPIFKGFRTDKSPKSVKRESPRKLECTLKLAKS